VAKPAAAVSLDPQQQKHLESLVRSGQTPPQIVLRARIVLLASQGTSNRSIAKKLGISRPTVLLWRARFRQAGVSALGDAKRPGRKANSSAKKSKQRSRPRSITRR